MIQIERRRSSKLYSSGSQPPWKRFSKYPFITYENGHYVEFMIMFMKGLQPRQFKKGEMIYQELDSAEEIYFIMQGRYDIGYELNYCKRYRIQFGERTVIAGFNVANDQRINFNYRAHSYISAYSIRRKTWKELQKDHELFTQHMNFTFLTNYNTQVLNPLRTKKLQEIKELSTRHDFNQYQMIESISNTQIQAIRRQIFCRIEETEKNQMLEHFNLNKLINRKIDVYEDLIDKFLNSQQ